MAYLEQIQFKYMFLVVNHVKGAIVLLPSDGHILTITCGASHTVTRAQLNFRRAGALNWGTACAVSGEPLVHFDTLFARPTRSSRALIESSPVPQNLNGRVVLSGGTFEVLKADDPLWADVNWRFIAANEAKFVQTTLTDRINFNFDAAKRPDQMRLVGIENGNPLDTGWIEIPDSLMTVTNDDLPRELPIDEPAGVTHELVEFSTFYEMFDRSFVPRGPFGESPGSKGVTEPICGGGQSGPDDPPADPPNP